MNTHEIGWSFQKSLGNKYSHIILTVLTKGAKVSRNQLYFISRFSDPIFLSFSHPHFIRITPYWRTIKKRRRYLEKPTCLMGVTNARLRTSGICYHPTSVPALILILLNLRWKHIFINLRTIDSKLGIFYIVSVTLITLCWFCHFKNEYIIIIIIINENFQYFIHIFLANRSVLSVRVWRYSITC